MSKQAPKHKSRRLRRFVRANEAVSALEYAILVGVIAVAIGAAITIFGADLKSTITEIGDKVDAVSTGTIQTAPSPF